MRTLPRSLRLRVTFFTTLVVALVLAGSSVMLVRSLESSQIDDSDHELSDQIDLVAGLISRNELTSSLKPTGIVTNQVQVMQVSSGTIIAVSPGLASAVRLDVFSPPAEGHQVARTTRSSDLGIVGNERFRVVARTVPSAIGDVTIYTTSSLRPADQAAHTLVLSLWIGLPILVLLAALAMWFLIGRALRPVDVMRREVDAIQGSRTDQRIAPDRRASELDQLAATLNSLLDRISASEAIRRQFLADASHELRSPLASARTMLEVGLAYPTRTDWPETASDVMVEVDRLQDLAGELLALARAEGGERALGLQHADLGTLAAGEVHRLNDERVSLVVAAPVDVVVDRPLIVRVLRNLLDNARRHADERITVSIGEVSTPEGDMAEVRIHNDGEEIPPSQREVIFEPFTRLDDARARDEGGAGLGLSIARRIAEVHGGTLAAVECPQGAEFVLRLPVGSADDER